MRHSILWQNAFDLYQVGGPLGTNLVGTDPLFTIDHRLALASPAVGAASNEGSLGAFPFRQCSDGRDNDGDGRTDLADAQCAHLDDFAEAPDPPPGCGLGPELVPALVRLGVTARARARWRPSR